MIENESVLLRAPEPDDVDSIFLWENDRPEADSEPVSRFNVWQYVQNYDGNIYTAGELRLVVVDKTDGRAVGLVDLYEFNANDRRAGVAIYIESQRRRQSLASAALALLEHHAGHDLGMHQLWAHIAADNMASRALFASRGFKPAGRLRSWLRRGDRYADVMVVQKML